jgi:hypothetical protein
MQTRASSKEWEEGNNPPPYLLPAYLVRCRAVAVARARQDAVGLAGTSSLTPRRLVAALIVPVQETCRCSSKHSFGFLLLWKETRVCVSDESDRSL